MREAEDNAGQPCDKCYHINHGRQITFLSFISDHGRTRVFVVGLILKRIEFPGSSHAGQSSRV